MADITPSRLGQINAAGGSLTADTALFLKVFSGEILEAFKEVNVAMERSLVRTISSGKSAQFPATWKAEARYHIPGQELTGNVINHAERIIHIDSLLIADAFIANIDEAMNHYDVRGPYKNQLGYALANQADKFLLQVMVLAARAAATVTGGFGGSELTNAAYDTDADTLVGGLFDAATALDEKDVPDDGQRYAFFPSENYHLMIQSERAVNRDWNAQGANGSYKTGKILEIAGIEIVKSNHIPQEDLTTITTPLVSAVTTNNSYEGDFSNVVGIVVHKSAVGTVKLLDLAFEMEYEIRRQGTLMVSKMAVGHGILRPESAVELNVA
jgi:major capsid protein